MKKTLAGLLCVMLIALSATCFAAETAAPSGNILTMAVAWKQTAAEYQALYYQAFNIAKIRIDQAIANRKEGDKPLCIITDVDDTIMLHNDYWGYLIANDYDFFDDPVWDVRVPDNTCTAAPGALELLNYCQENDVEVFYVTNRNQGDGTYQMAIDNLNALSFPYVDTDHVIVQIETSNKETPQLEIAEEYDVILLMGDNLNDFKRAYYVSDVDERIALMEADKQLFGDRFILLPNPTDGHWIRAIFGDSEPPANDENRQIWVDTATRSIWNGSLAE